MSLYVKRSGAWQLVGQPPPAQVINDLTDVDTASIVPAMLQDLAWDQSTSQWRPQNVPRIFASAAARDSAWPTPPNGAMCVTLDTYRVWLRKAGVWQPPPGTVVDQGFGNIDLGIKTVGGMYDMVAINLAANTYPVQITVNAVWQFGFGTGQCQVQGDIYRYVDGTVYAAAALYSPPAQWQRFAMSWSFPVPAGGNPTFKTRLNLLSIGGGNGCYFQGELSYFMTAT